MGLAINARKLVGNKVLGNKKFLRTAVRRVPNIVIVGDKKIRFRLKKFEIMFNLALVFVELHQLKEVINPSTISVIFDEEKMENKSKEIIKKFIIEHIDMPVFFLSRFKKTANFYIDLYQFGVQGIINWPSEGLMLPDLLIEALRVHPKATGLNAGDAKLSKLVKSHIILLGDYRSVQIKVLDGFLFLKGEVSTLWEKNIIEKECIKILGVKKVISKDLIIKNQLNTTNQIILKAINDFIKLINNEKKQSIEVAVKDFIVTIKGTGPHRMDFLSVEEFAMKQAGVQKIKRVFEIHNLNAIENQKIKLLEKSVSLIFVGVRNITIKIFGKNAEVSGFVKLPADIGLIESYILKNLPIEKVFNKLILKP